MCSTEMCVQSEVDAVQKMSNVIALKRIGRDPIRMSCNAIRQILPKQNNFFYYNEIMLQFAKNIQYDLHNVANKKTKSILFCR